MKKNWMKTVQSWVYLDTYLHLHGNEQLRVENCRRILEYNDVLVRVQTRDMTVEIWGSGLRVYDYNDSSIVVRGKISSVHLTQERKRNEKTV
jgi:sporulation protein YqfC